MVIQTGFREEMLAHARREFPNEACGLIATLDGRAMAIYPIRNAEASPVAYSMDSQNQLRAMLEIEDRGWELGGIYHSHTRTRAYPSRTDIARAFYPETTYIIVSLADFDDPEIRGFSIQGEEVREVQLTVAG
ncbi:MAG TPA: M67 family metallopeptidase [Chloroflexota bacterium]|nr:M67 family metallopeptidase [Chloroflexota bacterium]